ncbi:MAG: cysteine dioxygenase [Pseudomonadota bacterium]|nr:cysteine dioxygenase [Pseudomonadota bacterium]
MDEKLKVFITTCDELARSGCDANTCVSRAAPLMLELIKLGHRILSPDQMREDPITYARNAIHLGDAESTSLFALVWLPGQWTPVHDHGTWGVVGVLEGVLEERNFLRADNFKKNNKYYELQTGGIVLLNSGSVSTFVPNPDHIHMTGVPEDREKVISLHLYGKHMNSFHYYDLNRSTRRLIDVSHFDSR